MGRPGAEGGVSYRTSFLFRIRQRAFPKGPFRIGQTVRRRWSG